MKDYSKIAQIIRFTNDKKVAVKLANDWSQDQPRSEDGRFSSNGSSGSSKQKKDSKKHQEIKEVNTKYGQITSDISDHVTKSIDKHISKIDKKIKETVQQVIKKATSAGRRGSFTNSQVIDQIQGDIGYITAENIQKAWGNDNRLAKAWAASQGKKMTSAQKLAKQARKNPQKAIQALMEKGNVIHELSDYDIASYCEDYFDPQQEEYDDYDDDGYSDYDD